MPTTYTTADTVQRWLESVAGQGFTRLDLRGEKGGAPYKTWPRFPEGSAIVQAAEDAIARATNAGAAVQGPNALFLLEASAPGDARDSCHILVPGALAGIDGPEGNPQERFIRDLIRSQADMARILLTSEDGRARASERMITTMAAALDRAHAQIDGHETRRVSNLELYERLMSRDFERQQAARAAELAEKRWDRGFEKLDAVVPVVVNRLLGGGPGKGTPFMGEEMVKSILESLTPDLVEVFMAKLPPEKAAAFAELYMAYAAAEEKKKGRTINDGAGGGAGAGRTNGINQPPPPKGEPS